MASTIIGNLNKRFHQGDILTQLIYVNTGIFILFTVVRIAFLLFRQDIAFLFRYIQLPASATRFCTQPWSLFSYMFTHTEALHLLFNMLWLYWFGTLFLQLFSAKHLRGLYLFGGICGGLFYMLAYNIFPLFTSTAGYAYLTGASASVFAIVAAVAYQQPNLPVSLFIFGTIPIKYLAFFVLGTDLLFITAENAGGHISHIGGALSGLWFVWSLHRGIDLTHSLNAFIDYMTRLFRKKPSYYKKPKMEAHYGGKRQKDYDYNARKKVQDTEIDRILDKLRKSGYESLSSEEKKALFNGNK